MQPQRDFARRLPPNANLLDVGCGNFNRVYRYVARRRGDISVTGLERYLDATIYGASAIIPACADSPRFRRIACDIELEQFPFADNTFDGLYLSHVIEHVRNKSHVLRECRRVLRPGGVLYIETPGPRAATARRPRWAAPTLGGTINYGDDATHLDQPLTIASLRQLVESNELQVVRAGTFRELGLLGLPLYAAMAGLGLLPLMPFELRSFLFGAGYRNLVGWAIFALAQK